MRVVFLIMLASTLFAMLPGFLGLSGQATAHHILGRPAYNLNEDSNTPPSMQAEVQVGQYQMTYMIYPAFPQPGEGARVSLYIIGIDDGVPYDGKVAFTIREMPWASFLGDDGHEDHLSTQPPDDKVYRQGFTVPEAGDYLVTARFEGNGEPYVVDFPLRVGIPPLLGPFAYVGAGVLLLLIVIAVVRRRQAITAKIRTAQSSQSAQR